MTKTCTKCKLDKHPIDDFHRTGERRLARCKACVREAVKQYQESPEGKATRQAYIDSPKSREWWRKHNTSPEEKARNAAYQRTPKWLESRRMHNKTPQGSRVRKNIRLKSDYGITLEQYKKMFADQHGQCKICGTSDPGDKSFHVDHCHMTQRIRGLLCFNCNVGLGKFRDDPELLKKAVEYLRGFQ